MYVFKYYGTTIKHVFLSRLIMSSTYLKNSHKLEIKSYDNLHGYPEEKKTYARHNKETAITNLPKYGMFLMGCSQFLSQKSSMRMRAPTSLSYSTGSLRGTLACCSQTPCHKNAAVLSSVNLRLHKIHANVIPDWEISAQDFGQMFRQLVTVLQIPVNIAQYIMKRSAQPENNVRSPEVCAFVLFIPAQR